MARLILASSSPRRRELLAQIGIIPDIIECSDVDEIHHKNEDPRQYVLLIAKEKAIAIAEKNKSDLILAADTIVVCGGKILAKAENNLDVEKYLKKLSGRQHTVMTSVCVVVPLGSLLTKIVTTKVKFKRLSTIEIQKYIKSGEGIGKAGGYAIQGMAGSFVKNINGSYSAVVGLPLYETIGMLRSKNDI